MFKWLPTAKYTAIWSIKRLKFKKLDGEDMKPGNKLQPDGVDLKD